MVMLSAALRDPLSSKKTSPVFHGKNSVLFFKKSADKKWESDASGIGEIISGIKIIMTFMKQQLFLQPEQQWKFSPEVFGIFST